MTKKELSQLYYLNREIEQDKRKLAELESAVTSGVAKITGLPHVTGISDKVGDYAVEIAELREIIRLNLRRSILEYNRLNRYISDIQDSEVRQILTHRYVDGMRWQQVASHMGGMYTADAVKKICYRFLAKR
jgi:hypothetical protein